MAVSLYHKGSNINRGRVRELTGQSGPEADRPGPARPPRPPRPPLHDWLVSWIEAEDEPGEHLDSLPGVMWHLADAWGRRTSPGRTGADHAGPDHAGPDHAGLDHAGPDHAASAGANPAVLLVH